MCDLRIPVAMCTGEAMHENDRRSDVACDDVVDEGHSSEVFDQPFVGWLRWVTVSSHYE